MANTKSYVCLSLHVFFVLACVLPAPTPQDSLGTVLGDFWKGSFQVQDPLTLSELTWSQVNIISAAVPMPRYAHAAAALYSDVYGTQAFP